MYISTATWRDLEDGHPYRTGDPFPYDGRDVSEDRISELTSPQNKAGFAVIKAIADPVEEKPIEEDKPARKVSKNRKKGE
jgi:hypothetical protein